MVTQTGGHSPGPLYDPLRSLNMTKHRPTKITFGTGFESARIKMKKIPLGESHIFQNIPNTPGVPVRTNKELERTGREMFIGKLSEDSTKIPKVKKKKMRKLDSDSEEEEDEDVRNLREKEEMRAKIKHLQNLAAS